MRPPTTTITPLYLEVAPRDIAAVKVLFESYEGVGIVRTLDRLVAVVVVVVATDLVAHAEAIAAALERDFGVRRVPPPAAAADDWLLQAAEDAPR